MSYLYTAHLLHGDDGFSDIDFGASASESTVARLALRLSNAEKHDTCVVRRDTVRGDQQITQRIRWKGLAVAERTAIDLDIHRRSLSRIPLSEAMDTVELWAGQGYAVTVSPAAGSTTLFNIIAHK